LEGRTGSGVRRSCLLPLQIDSVISMPNRLLSTTNSCKLVNLKMRTLLSVKMRMTRQVRRRERRTLARIQVRAAICALDTSLWWRSMSKPNFDRERYGERGEIWSSGQHRKHKISAASAIALPCLPPRRRQRQAMSDI